MLLYGKKLKESHLTEEAYNRRLSISELSLGAMPKLLVLSHDGSYEHRHEKTGFCICENKDADQLRGNREADQRLCFRYTYSTIPLLPISEISNL